MATRRSDDVALSDRLAKAATSEGRTQRIVYDGGSRAVGGFGLRVTTGGSKSFILTYRTAQGDQRRMTIGSYPTWSVERARRRAAELKRSIGQGADPLKTRREELAAPTVADLCDRYVTDHLPRKRASSQGDDVSMMTHVIRPRLGSRKVAAVDFREVDKLHQSLRETPYKANRVLALLSKMFALAIRWGWRADNPCRGIERFAEARRERFLSVEELRQLTTVLANFRDQRAANVVRLALLTGARSGEILGARWADIDIERGTWTKPGATTKQGTVHVAPLSEAAVVVLRGINRTASPFVFRAEGDPERHLSEIKDEWQAIREAADIPDVRFHDLRHSFASLLASGGASLPMIGALLGHTQAQTTARYAHLFSDPLRKLADEVGRTVNGTAAAQVVPLRGRGSE